jgi:hypothetical protein
MQYVKTSELSWADSGTWGSLRVAHPNMHEYPDTTPLVSSCKHTYIHTIHTQQIERDKFLLCHATCLFLSFMSLRTYTSTVVFKGTPGALIVRDAAVHAL